MINNRIAALVASGALAASVAIAGPATANNYAPGLPPAQQGVPNNPPTVSLIVPGVTLVSASEADNTRARVMRKAPSQRISDAPNVRARTDRPIALVVTGETSSSWNDVAGLAPRSRYIVYIKQPGGEYGTLGTVVGSPFPALPVFKSSQPGALIIALKDVKTGETFYIKVRIRK